MNSIAAFFKKHLSTRRKEIILGVMIWLIGLIGTGSKDPLSLPYMVLGLFAGLLALLSITVVISLFSPLNENERKKEPLLIDLVRSPGEKKKWLVFLIFLFLLISIIVFRFFLYKPEILRFFVTAFGAFIGIFLVELLHSGRKR